MNDEERGREDRPLSTFAGYQDALRMSDAELHEILAKRGGGGKQAAVRAAARMQFPPGTVIPVIFTQLGGNESRVLAKGLDIATKGIGVLHGGFVYDGTRATLHVPAVDGERLTMEGTVVRCFHIKGRAHEIGIQFDQRVDLSMLLSDFTTEEAAERTALNEIAGLGRRLASLADSTTQPFDLADMLVQITKAWAGALVESAHENDETLEPTDTPDNESEAAEETGNTGNTSGKPLSNSPPDLLADALLHLVKRVESSGGSANTEAVVAQLSDAWAAMQEARPAA